MWKTEAYKNWIRIDGNKYVISYETKMQKWCRWAEEERSRAAGDSTWSEEKVNGKPLRLVNIRDNRSMSTMMTFPIDEWPLQNLTVCYLNWIIKIRKLLQGNKSLNSAFCILSLKNRLLYEIAQKTSKWVESMSWGHA